MPAPKLPPPLPEAFWDNHRGDSLGAILDAQGLKGDVFALPFGKQLITFVCHPELAYEVLVRQKDIFVKLGSDGTKAGLQAVLGQGLLTNTEHKTWFRQRRMLQPVFHRERLARLAHKITQAGERLLGQWQALPDGSEIDVWQAMMDVTRDIIYQLVFSLEPEEAKQHPIDVPLGLATVSAKKVREINKQHDKVIFALIARRRQERSAGIIQGDLLDMLLEARDADTGEEMSEQQLRDELLTIFSAGHETTANALTWAWYLLAGHGQVSERLRLELDSRLHGRAPSVSQISDLPYTKAVIKETLRLYPSIPAAPRVALEDTHIAGYDVPKGTRVFVSIYAVQRHPDFWEAYNSFYPERFLAGQESHQLAYMPFGLGERVCLGQHLAMLEAQLLLAQLAQQVHFELVSDAPVPQKVAISLFPRRGMPLRLRHRRGSIDG